MMESKNFISKNKFKIKNENKDLVSFIGQALLLDYQLEKFISF